MPAALALQPDLVGLGSAGAAFDHPALVSVDRLHLSPEGHDRVAQAVLEWPGQPHRAAPWLHRRLTGRSCGGLVESERP